MENTVLFSLPALLKILLTFVALLLLNRVLPLYVCLALTSIIIGLWMQMPALSIVQVMLQESFSGPVLALSLAISLILVFSDLLRRSGRLERIVSSLKAITSRPKVSLVVLPALIGLLPMPGGALFSAPMIETALGETRIKPELKLAINYWFRHVMEFMWPLYPGFILALSIFGLEAWKLMLFQAPITIGAIIAGILFILPAVSICQDGVGHVSPDGLRDFAREVFPIAIIIVLMFVLQGCAEAVNRLFGKPVPLSQHLSMAIALIAGIVYLVYADSMSRSDAKSAFFHSGIGSIILMVFAIMAFKGVLEQSGTIAQLRTELQAFRIPEIIVIVLLPLIAGLVTGIAVGFVGSSFPLIATLLPNGENVLPYVILAYGFGFIGMMLSPVHLCFLVTQEYFQTNSLDSYKHFWKPAIFLMPWLAFFFSVYRFAV
ncbi:MAG: DUF401 family protein [Desulfomonile tiedjei]|uniref:DUF401 family protein n=1 Tax=Desulfomonile tiedjei TaxID=2358 RepID=A0A9D6V236_9BACT|nr:DUF401 family protein [Desulfomonile tiedjei]